MTASTDERWPALPLAAWQGTYETLHMYTQIVGKVRFELSPMQNHWWQVALYATPRGLTTSPMPYGDRTCQIDFDFVDHELVISESGGAIRRLPLGCQVKELYAGVMGTLAELGMPVEISLLPSEVPDPVPCHVDTREEYDRAAVTRWFELLLRADSVFRAFRVQFTGKVSPSHFFWGAFDLAVTRFSGRHAAPPPDADHVNHCGYNAELISLGFWPGGVWPGGATVESPIFYSYTYPAPDGLADAAVRPDGAGYDERLGEFVLPLDAVRAAPDPAAAVMAFAQSTYEAGARLQDWPVEQFVLRVEKRPSP